MQPAVDYPAVVVVFYCHDGQGNFVMGLRGDSSRDKRGRWDIGSGLLHHGERLEEAVRREVKEEYCAQARNIQYLGHREVFRQQGTQTSHVIAMDYAVTVDHEEVRRGEPEKLDAVEWFTQETLPSPLHSQFETFMDLYGDRL